MYKRCARRTNSLQLLVHTNAHATRHSIFPFSSNLSLIVHVHVHLTATMMSGVSFSFDLRLLHVEHQHQHHVYIRRRMRAEANGVGDVELHVARELDSSSSTTTSTSISSSSTTSTSASTSTITSSTQSASSALDELAGPHPPVSHSMSSPGSVPAPPPPELLLLPSHPTSGRLSATLAMPESDPTTPTPASSLLSYQSSTSAFSECTLTPTPTSTPTPSATASAPPSLTARFGPPPSQPVPSPPHSLASGSERFGSAQSSSLGALTRGLEADSLSVRAFPCLLSSSLLSSQCTLQYIHRHRRTASHVLVQLLSCRHTRICFVLRGFNFHSQN